VSPVDKASALVAPDGPVAPGGEATRPAGTTTTSSPTSGGPAVRGDGTTAASRAGRRWRASRVVLVGLLSALLAGLVLVALTPSTTTVRLDPGNPSPDGAMALAQVLGDQGVDVRSTRSVAEAVGLAGPGTTLLVVDDYGMPDDVARSLLDTGAEVVLVAPGPALLAAATDQVTHASRSPQPTTPSPARCTEPDAVAAGEVTTAGGRFRAVDGAASATALCFTDDSGAGHYAVTTLDGSPDVSLRVLDDGSGLTNAAVTTAGNAALGLRMLGHEQTLVWLVPERPTTADDGGGITAYLPPWAVPLAAQLLLVVLVLGLWQGRRLGPLATEDLPVVVRSSETTLGRGRLYRRSRSYGHAGASLRAGSADRMARRLGLPRSSSPDALVDAVCRATGRPPEHVSGLLYGPPPTGDVGLTRLATDLDELESEVHRA